MPLCFINCGIKAFGIATMVRPIKIITFLFLAVFAASFARADYPKSKQERELDKMESIAGPEGITFHPGRIKNESTKATPSDSSINSFLWQAALDTLIEMPLISADIKGGVILTDWYRPKDGGSSEFKINVFIKGDVISPDSIEVRAFERSSDKKNKSEENKAKTASLIEKKIIEKARSLYIRSGASKK